MKHQVFNSSVALLICVLSMALMVGATGPSTVSPDNLVLRDALGNIIAVSLNVQWINNTDGNVQIYRMLVENGTSYPAGATSGYLFFRTDLNALCFYNGTAWTVGTGGTGADLSPYMLISSAANFLLQNGTRPLLANWNAGNYGIYSLSYISTTTIFCTDIQNRDAGGYVRTVKLIIENASTAPSTPVTGYIYFDTALNAPYIYNGTHWLPLYNSTSSGGAAVDLSVYIFTNGTRALTDNWNVGGSYGIYGLTWLNTTNINAVQYWWNNVNRTDILAFPQDSYNYLIFKDGGVTYSKIGNTGQVTSTTIQACIDAVTTVGGSIIVKNGTYSEAVTLKNNVRLVLDKGCTGVTVSIDAGATAVLEDYQNSINWYYASGILVLQYNNINGLITGLYSSFREYWSLGLNRTDAVVNPVGPYSYIVDVVGSLYRMKNGTTGQFDYVSSNLTKVEQFASGNLTSGLIYLKDVAWNSSLPTAADNVMIIQEYLGEVRYISGLAKFLIPQLATDPNTTGWTQAEQGRMWFNTASDTMKYWNGSATVVFPSIGGSNPNTYVLPYSYTVYAVGSTYYMEKSDGTTWSSSNFSKVSEFANGNLTEDRTWKETIVYKGNFTLTASLVISSWTHWILDGRVTMISGGTFDMITNAHHSSYDYAVEIEGGTWDGQAGGSGTWHGINWVQASGTFFDVNVREIWLHDFYLWVGGGTTADAIHIDTSGASYPNIFYIWGVDASSNVHYGLYATGMTDSVIGGSNHFGGNTYGIYMYACAHNTISGFKTDGGVYLWACNEFAIGDFAIDPYNRNIDGITIHGGLYNTICNGQIRAASDSGYNTKSAVQMEKRGSSADQACNFNSISNVYCGRAGGLTSTQRWAYGIHEAESSTYVNYNLYCNINANDASSGNLVQGAQSKIANSLP